MQKAATELLESNVAPLSDSPRRFIEMRLLTLARDPLFTDKQQGWLKERRTASLEPKIKAHWQKLVRFGIATPKEVLTPLLPGKTLAEAKWTKFELAHLEAFHAALLADLVFPGMLQVNFQVNFVDHRLSVPREWRDVYRYDAKGEYIGWMRYSADGVQFFNHEGLLAVEKDNLWRCVKGRTVGYVQDPPKMKYINTSPLRMLQGDTLVHYEFDGPNDMRGRRIVAEGEKSDKK
jgi:hypothetical protein